MPGEIGGPGETWTRDREIMSLLLWPTELPDLQAVAVILSHHEEDFGMNDTIEAPQRDEAYYSIFRV